MSEEPFPPLEERVRLALREDLSSVGDVTTCAVFGEAETARATVVAKDSGVLCGVEPFQLVFTILGGVTVYPLKNDGEGIIAGETVAELEGNVRSLLSGERTALNFLQRLSGIASLTAQYVAAAEGTDLRICDTRKTTPLWRDLEKHAVHCGGGMNHRFGLYDMVMLKDTHADGAGELAEALRRVAHLRPPLSIAAEARNMEEVRAALAAGVDLLMLDNMQEDTLREAIALAKGQAEVEITGGVTVEAAAKLAKLGAGRISVGAVTHSAPALDFSMRLDLEPPQ